MDQLSKSIIYATSLLTNSMHSWHATVDKDASRRAKHGTPQFRAQIKKKQFVLGGPENNTVGKIVRHPITKKDMFCELILVEDVESVIKRVHREKAHAGYKKTNEEVSYLT